MKLTIQKEVQMLRGVSLFRSVKPEDLKIIALTTTNYIYESGEIIINEGDEGDDAYIIYTGRVEVFRKGTDVKIIALNTLGPGEMFGELALFGDSIRTASVKAVEETVVSIIAKEKLYKIIREFPDIAIEMLKVQTSRFAEAEKKLIEFIKAGEDIST
jgi:CRP/FNR family transcriptional regulator